MPYNPKNDSIAQEKKKEREKKKRNKKKTYIFDHAFGDIKRGHLGEGHHVTGNVGPVLCPHVTCRDKGQRSFKGQERSFRGQERSCEG